MNYLILKDSVILNYNGKTLPVKREDDRYEKVVDLIRRGRLDEIPDAVEIERQFNGNGVELIDGLLHANGQALPPELNERILALKNEGLPVEPLFKFWEKLKVNPSFNSRQMLFKFLQHNGHPITQEGDFIAYRGVTEDFRDCHTKTFDNRPGNVCEIAREAVDDNPNNTCSTGLHVACYDYAKGFGPKLVEVKVNPADVVCVPTDYNGTKMRVSRFEVVQECENMRTEQLYGYEEDDSEEDVCEEEDSNVCAECGADEVEGMNYCPDCGNKL